MTLEFLQKEMIKAMKDKNKKRKEVISALVQAVKKYGIDNKCKDNILENQVDMVILKEKKTMQEMIDTCPKEREDLLNDYKEKMAVIDEFAPVLMTSEDEIKDFVNSLGIELTKANRCNIMKELKGKADMKIANKVISLILS